MNDEKMRVLVVDDIETNRIILQEILSDTYEIEQAQDGIEAISKLINSVEKPKIILLDVMMPGLDGFGVISYMKSDPVLTKIPVIFITASDQEVQGLKAGAVDYISKPFEPEIVRLRVASQLELSLYREELEGLVAQKANELIVTREHFLDTMANLIEYRSLESGLHVKRTKDLARVLAMQLVRRGGPYAEDLQASNPNAMVKAVPLHDIGKIGIPDNILLKPGRLTPEEFVIIETHTVIGGQVIQSLREVGEDDYLKHCYNI
ncbi:MAG: response regulator, partial [Clostridiales bacterium]|nr:response regulator [Clostridiales bacterium]